MQDIIKEYGPALITIVAVLAVLAIVQKLLSDNGSVTSMFDQLITKMQGFTNTINSPKP